MTATETSETATADLARAANSTMEVLKRVRAEQMAAPTPCASWDVHALINHFVGSARFWAALFEGKDDAPAPDSASEDYPSADYAAGDFVAAYEESIRIACAAFTADGALERTVRLGPDELPGAVVLGFATTDQFTHGWDLARAIGQPADDLDPELAERLLAQARMAVTDSYRGVDGVAVFGPERPAPAEASPADRLAAFLGRSM
ncbi:MAG TPA: TIGR03086 family metal-binding protein [Frankiaceae bacterium]|jgi:uncharacterized protein (TIGR03086 family)|nr:TIGR03086 family metal-binding protein [Frankiaceae bacterium]